MLRLPTSRRRQWQEADLLPGYRPDDLGVLQVVANSMSATTPFTVVAGVVTTGYVTTGQIGIPVMFLAIAALLALFAGGFVAMSRTMKNAANVGGLYAYIARGLGRPVAVGSAWSAVIAYVALQVGLYGLIAPAASPIIQRIFGSDVPWWIVALALWVVVAVLGTRRVAFNTRVLIVLLIAEVGVIVLYSLANLGNPAGGVVTYDGLLPNALLTPAAGAICGLAWVGFVGVESPVVHSSRARDPRRTIPRAMYLSIGLTAVLYTVSSWAMAVATGPDRIVSAAQEHQADLIFVQAGQNLGQLSVDVGRVLFVTSLLAAAVSFHLISAQYIQALGRERIMPAAFARLSARTNAPIYGSFLQSGIGLAVIIIWAAAGWDPLLALFFGVGASGGIGVLLVITLTALAVAAFFAREHDQEARTRRLIVAVIAAIGLLVVTVLAITNLTTLLGVAETSPLRWIIPGVYGAIILLGTVWGFILRTRGSDIYSGIGSGAHSLTTPHSNPERNYPCPNSPSPWSTTRTNSGSSRGASPTHSLTDSLRSGLCLRQNGTPATRSSPDTSCCTCGSAGSTEPGRWCSAPT